MADVAFVLGELELTRFYEGQARDVSGVTRDTLKELTQHRGLHTASLSHLRGQIFSESHIDFLKEKVFLLA